MNFFAVSKSVISMKGANIGWKLSRSCASVHRVANSATAMEFKNCFFNDRTSCSKLSKSSSFSSLENSRQDQLCFSSTQQFGQMFDSSKLMALGSLLVLFANKRKFSSEAAHCESPQQVSHVKLGNVDDFSQGESYEIQVPGSTDKVLLTYVNGTFYCTGSKCPHYGAPLSKGIACKDRVVCPWHYAEFDLKTGKCINGPTSNAIPCYEVTVESDGAVYANLTKSSKPEFAKFNPKEDPRIFVVVGGGVAASAAIQTLRREGFVGRILLFSEEDSPPYDRVLLSKNLQLEKEKILLKPATFINETLNVEMHLNERVDTVDLDAQKLKTANGKQFKFDKILLCTGSKARRLENTDSKGVHYIRNVKDVEAIQESLFKDPNQLKNLKCVIIGSSFLGMELTSALKKVGINQITMVGQDAVPFQATLGSRIGGAFGKLLTSNSIEYIPKSSVESFIKNKDDNSICGVKLTSGVTIQADRAYVCIGAIPTSPEILHKMPDALGRKQAKGGILCDPFMRISTYPNAFVAGDIAAFPYVKTGEYVRIEHYSCALQQGRVAAMNMLDMYRPYTDTPFFWTSVFGKSLRVCGIIPGYTDIVIEGDVETMQFVAYYLKDERVTAVATMGKDPVAVAAAEAMRLNIMPTAGELSMGIRNSNDIIQRVKAQTIVPVGQAKKCT